MVSDISIAKEEVVVICRAVLAANISGELVSPVVTNYQIYTEQKTIMDDNSSIIYPYLSGVS
jgi:peptidyl-tRNA hydrolase